MFFKRPLDLGRLVRDYEAFYLDVLKAFIENIFNGRSRPILIDPFRGPVRYRKNKYVNLPMELINLIVASRAYLRNLQFYISDDEPCSDRQRRQIDALCRYILREIPGL